MPLVSMRVGCALLVSFALTAPAAALDPPARVVTIPACLAPSDVAVNTATGEAAVGCVDSVLLVEPGTLKRTMFPVEYDVFPANFSVAVDPVRDRVFAADRFRPLMVIERPGGITETVNVGWGTAGPVVDGSTNKIYLPRPGLAYHTGVGYADITVVDGATLEPHDVRVGIGPGSIAIDEARNRIYVANYGDMHTESRVVTVIDGATETTGDLLVPTAPISLVFDPTHDRLAVASTGGSYFPVPGGSSVSVIDGATLSVRSVPIDAGVLRQLAVNPATGKIYALTYGGAAPIFEIDENTLAVAEIPVSDPVARIAIDSARNIIYGTNAAGHTVTLIDGATHEALQVEVGSGPSALAVDSTRDTVWVANFADGSVSVLYGPAAPCLRCPRAVSFR